MDSRVTRLRCGLRCAADAAGGRIAFLLEFSQIMAADATESINDPCSIGDLARELDVTPRAIRFYEEAPDDRPQLEKFVAALGARREQLERQREEIDEVLEEIRGFERQSKKLLNARSARRR